MGKIYAVRIGRTTGLFKTWKECQESISGVSGAEFKSFATKTEAEKYIQNGILKQVVHKYGSGKRSSNEQQLVHEMHDKLLNDIPNNAMIIYADGSCIPNPGIGGSGVVLQYNVLYDDTDKLKELLSSIENCSKLIIRDTLHASDVTKLSEKKNVLSKKNKVDLHKEGGSESVKVSKKRKLETIYHKQVGTPDDNSPEMFRFSVEQQFCFAVGTNVTNNICELHAIEMALVCVRKTFDLIGKQLINRPVYILTDSSYSIGVFVKEWVIKKNQKQIKRIQAKLDKSKEFCQVNFKWVAGHCKLKGNELADALADKGREKVIIEY